MKYLNWNINKRANAKLAGILYLLIALIGSFSIGYVPNQIVVDGDAALTLHQFMENQLLFRAGIVGDILVFFLEIVLTVVLFVQFKSHGSLAIYIATYCRLAMAIIMGINLLHYVGAIIIVNQPEVCGDLYSGQTATIVSLLFEVHHYGILIWQLFFALHLMTLGYVLLKGSVTPKILTFLLLLGGLGYGGDSLQQLTFSNSIFVTILFAVLLGFAVVGELWFAFWLLIKSGKSPTTCATSPSVYLP